MSVALEDLDLVSAFRADTGAGPAGLDWAAHPLARELPGDVFLLGSYRAQPAFIPGELSTRGESPRAHRKPRPRGEGPLQRWAVLDKFRIEELIGSGGFAFVYRATHLLLRIPVAIKLLRPEHLEHDDAAARLVEEARCAARINHANVVRIHDVTHTPQITYIVMEYIEGRSLARAIRAAGPLPPHAVARLGLDVVAGLRAGLQEGLVHRDIKPANILLSRGGGARIVDFGLARASTAERGERSLVGTRGYVAPEVVDGLGADFRADIFSLGVTLYEAAAGARPLLPYGAAKAWPPPDLPSDLPRPLGETLRWMLMPRREERPASYDLLEHALQDAFKAMG